MRFRSLGYGIAALAVAVSCMVQMRVLAQAVGGPAPQDGVHRNLPKSAVQTAIKAAEARPTPRTADGHPDLNGFWDSPVNALADKSAHVDAHGNVLLGVVDPIPATLPPHRMDPNPPPYKPELLAKVKDLAAHEIDVDPSYHCIPVGVPRSGAPRQIVQTPKLTVFLYQIDSSNGPGDYRLVPTDGRPHRTDVDPSYDGDSIGHWEQDTLVIDVNQLSDETWLSNGEAGPGDHYGSGYFHSDALHVVERLTRKGDTLHWEATVEDPNVLTKPWVMTPQTEILTDAMVYEQPICEERDAKHIVDRY